MAAISWLTHAKAVELERESYKFSDDSFRLTRAVVHGSEYSDQQGMGPYRRAYEYARTHGLPESLELTVEGNGVKIVFNEGSFRVNSLLECKEQNLVAVSQVEGDRSLFTFGTKTEKGEKLEILFVPKQQVLVSGRLYEGLQIYVESPNLDGLDLGLKCLRDGLVFYKVDMQHGRGGEEPEVIKIKSELDGLIEGLQNLRDLQNRPKDVAKGKRFELRLSESDLKPPGHPKDKPKTSSRESH